MALFDTFQALVGRAQGATRLFVRAGGFFNVGDVTGGVDGIDVTGAQLRGILAAAGAVRTSYVLASAIQTVSIIPVKFGVVNFYYPSATTSVKLPSAELGYALKLLFHNILSTVSILPGNASIAAGVSDVSCIMMSNTSKGAWVDLFCFTQGEWAVAAQAPTAVTDVQRST